MDRHDLPIDKMVSRGVTNIMAKIIVILKGIISMLPHPDDSEQLLQYYFYKKDKWLRMDYDLIVTYDNDFQLSPVPPPSLALPVKQVVEESVWLVMIEKMVPMMSVVLPHKPLASIVSPLELWSFGGQHTHRDRCQVHFLGGLYRIYNIVQSTLTKQCCGNSRRKSQGYQASTHSKYYATHCFSWQDVNI
jgi:hypothetical protein